MKMQDLIDQAGQEIINTVSEKTTLVAQVKEEVQRHIAKMTFEEKLDMCLTQEIKFPEIPLRISEKRVPNCLTLTSKEFGELIDIDVYCVHLIQRVLKIALEAEFTDAEANVSTKGSDPCLGPVVFSIQLEKKK